MISVGKIIKFTLGLVVLLPAAVESVLTLRGPKADVTENTRSGSLLYRPDGEDSTLLCFQKFSAAPSPVGYRVYDPTGNDEYPENFERIINGGNSLGLTECRPETNGKMSRNQLIKCLDSTAQRQVTTKTSHGKRLFVEKIDYADECAGPANPKNVKVLQMSVDISAEQPSFQTMGIKKA